MIKKLSLAAILLVLLALGWAALHDILKGEPNLYGEYGMLVLSAILFTALTFVILRKRGKAARSGECGG
ncbi:MAG: hypothetical protein WBB22_07380 [Anaerolineae bacterium]